MNLVKNTVVSIDIERLAELKIAYHINNFDADHNDISKMYYRVVWCKPKFDHIYIVQMYTNNGMPVSVPKSVILDNIERGVFSIEDLEEHVLYSSENPSEKQYARANYLYECLKVLLNDNPESFIPSIRSKTIDIISSKTGCRRDTLYTALRRYYQGGQTRLAMAPSFHLRGQRKKLNLNDEEGTNPDILVVNPGKKRGRKGKLHGEGVSGEECADVFELVLSTHPFAKMKRKLKDLYKYLIKHYFADKKPYDCPSYKQFLYYKNKNKLDFLKRIFGSHEFKKKFRPLTRDYLQSIAGPGAQFEIDATVADAFVIALIFHGQFIERSQCELTQEEVNSVVNMVIGRPVVYAVRDSFSRVVVGLHIGVEGPSWMDAGSAMEAAMTNMRSLLNLYDIKEKDLVLPDGYSLEDVFPCAGLPDKLLGDNEVFDSENLPKGLLKLGVDVDTAPVRRPDLKPVIEKYFDVVQEYVKPYTPSMPLKPDEIRLKKDPRSRACQTLRDYVILMINASIRINLTAIEDYPLTQEMIKDGLVVATPVDIWSWGVKNKTGLPNKPPMKEFRAAVLKRKTVSSSSDGRGFRFYKNLFYTCQSGEVENWFHKGAQTKTIELLYDPRNMDSVYFYNSRNEIEQCTMTGRSKRMYAGLGLDDIVHLTHYLEVAIFDKKFSDIHKDKYDEVMTELVQESKKRGKPVVDNVRGMRALYKQHRRRFVPELLGSGCSDESLPVNAIPTQNEKESPGVQDVNKDNVDAAVDRSQPDNDASKVSIDKLFDL